MSPQRMCPCGAPVPVRAAGVHVVCAMRVCVVCARARIVHAPAVGRSVMRLVAFGVCVCVVCAEPRRTQPAGALASASVVGRRRSPPSIIDMHVGVWQRARAPRAAVGQADV